MIYFKIAQNRKIPNLSKLLYYQQIICMKYFKNLNLPIKVYLSLKSMPSLTIALIFNFHIFIHLISWCVAFITTVLLMISYSRKKLLDKKDQNYFFGSVWRLNDLKQ